MRRWIAILLLLGLVLAPVPLAQAQPAPGLLAFAGPYGLWTIDSNGKGEQLLPSGANADMPAWSPEGKRLVYVIGGTPEAGAWILDLTTGQRTQITRDPWRWPTWSPDGKKIAFTIARPFGSDIGVYNLETGAAAILTPNGVNESPSWWKDGSRLLFSRNNELWVMAADGSEAGPMRGLTDVPVLQAAWSPDGLRLAYLTVAKDRNFLDPTAPTQLWVATVEGFDGQYIAQGNIDRTQRISWSPDGTRIAFSTFTAAGTDIYSVYATGGDWFRLSDGRNPQWRPAVPDVSRPVSTVCQRAPERMYAKAFATNPSVQQRIGCPTDQISTVDGVMQQFERGFMYFRNVPSGTSVYVFFDDGGWAAGDPRPGPPVPNVAPPPGKQIPRNAFLNVWLSMGGPASRIGWATSDETGFASDLQPYERGLGLAGNNRVIFVNIDGTYDQVLVPN